MQATALSWRARALPTWLLPAAASLLILLSCLPLLSSSTSALPSPVSCPLLLSLSSATNVVQKTSGGATKEVLRQPQTCLLQLLQLHSRW